MGNVYILPVKLWKITYFILLRTIKEAKRGVIVLAINPFAPQYVELPLFTERTEKRKGWSLPQACLGRGCEGRTPVLLLVPAGFLKPFSCSYWCFGANIPAPHLRQAMKYCKLTVVWFSVP